MRALAKALLPDEVGHGTRLRGLVLARIYQDQPRLGFLRFGAQRRERAAGAGVQEGAVNPTLCCIWRLGSSAVPRAVAVMLRIAKFSVTITAWLSTIAAVT